MTNDFAWMHLKRTKRTQIVWASFFVVMSAMLVLLQAGGGDIQGGVLLTNISSMNERPEVDPIFNGEIPIDTAKWSGIVIQHLGEPAGSIKSIQRSHLSGGLDGIAFHFIIGNGNGLGDGVVHGSDRWVQQTKAARPISIDPENWDENLITICLIGNGNRRQFTERQILHLSRLVQRLQNELSIKASDVYLSSDLENSPNMAPSPGKFFAEALFRSQLLDIASTF
ncbi:MAG: N-acetylmuramoyl-L-alanine amidase [Planctomycetes bacterium]|nr:N-acetylmuramoyl-L-alanine amidase [Planctomycetota bacterium]